MLDVQVSWQVVQVLRLLKSQIGGQVWPDAPSAGRRSFRSSSTSVSRFSVNLLCVLFKPSPFAMR